MNRTDLRIAFKMDTGEDSLWAKDHDGKGIYGVTTFIKGHPRTIYGLWLEEKIGKPKYLRDRFFKLNTEWPSSNYFNPGGNEVLYSNYIEWLEEFVLKFKPEIVTNIIKL